MSVPGLVEDAFILFWQQFYERVAIAKALPADLLIESVEILQHVISIHSAKESRYPCKGDHGEIYSTSNSANSAIMLTPYSVSDTPPCYQLDALSGAYGDKHKRGEASEIGCEDKEKKPMLFQNRPTDFFHHSSSHVTPPQNERHSHFYASSGEMTPKQAECILKKYYNLNGKSVDEEGNPQKFITQDELNKLVESYEKELNKRKKSIGDLAKASTETFLSIVILTFCTELATKYILPLIKYQSEDPRIKTGLNWLQDYGLPFMRLCVYFYSIQQAPAQKLIELMKTLFFASVAKFFPISALNIIGAVNTILLDPHNETAAKKIGIELGMLGATSATALGKCIASLIIKKQRKLKLEPSLTPPASSSEEKTTRRETNADDEGESTSPLRQRYVARP